MLALRDRVEDMLKERIQSSHDRREQDFWLDELIGYRRERDDKETLEGLEDAERR